MNYWLKRRKYKLLKDEKRWVYEQALYDREKKLKEAKKPYKKSMISTTKLIVFFIFLNCSVVEIYSMWVMYSLRDISALYTLITAVVGETISFAIYAVKATKENTIGGIQYQNMINNSPTPPQEEESVG